MMKNTVCFKLKNAIVYNKGTEWETCEDTFLLCYGKADDKEQEKLIAKLNEDLKNGVLPKDQPLMPFKAEDIEYFFTNKQKPFNTKGN